MERTAEEVAAAAAELHKRAGTFAEQFGRMGRQLDSATTAYDQPVGSFEGRVLSQLRRIEQLDSMAPAWPVAEPAAIDTPAPLVLCESRSPAGVLVTVASDLPMSVAATNGQCGGFLRTHVAPLIRDGHPVLYLGDFDAGATASRGSTSWTGQSVSVGTSPRREREPAL